jgi:hypothetical protein
LLALNELLVRFALSGFAASNGQDLCGGRQQLVVGGGCGLWFAGMDINNNTNDCLCRKRTVYPSQPTASQFPRKRLLIWHGMAWYYLPKTTRGRKQTSRANAANLQRSFPNPRPAPKPFILSYMQKNGNVTKVAPLTPAAPNSFDPNRSRANAIHH